MKLLEYLVLQLRQEGGPCWSMRAQVAHIHTQNIPEKWASWYRKDTWKILEQTENKFKMVRTLRLLES